MQVNTSGGEAFNNEVRCNLNCIQMKNATKIVFSGDGGIA